MAPRLSICIATYNRAGFIAETLGSIVSQLEPGVELLVLDGASPDDTASVVEGFVSSQHMVRYIRESVNSGVDADYDKAVSHARGDYCWLMTDDDLLEPGAVKHVLAALDGEPAVVVVNAHVFTSDFSARLIESCLASREDREYQGSDEAFLVDTANYLSFIGGVVIHRDLWLQRDRATYYGTAFVHVGVLFQSPPVGRVKVLGAPMVRIRYGNAMWTARGFEIWLVKWPRLIWSFAAYSDAAKARVWMREPWKSVRKLIHARAIGSFSLTEYRQFIAGRAPRGAAMRAWFIARMPAQWANLIAGAYCVFVNRTAKATIYDLARSVHATWMSRWAARLAGI
jgi:hypothetical protein